MHDGVLVGVLQSLGDLRGDGQNLVDRHRPQGHPLRERMPFH